MSFIAAGLASSGALSATGLAGIVAVEGLDEPTLAAHPAVVRPAHRVSWARGSAERAVKLAASDRVLDELLTMAPPRAVVGLGELTGTVSARVVQELVTLAGTGPTTDARALDARWVLLRSGDRQVRADAVVSLAAQVGMAAPPWKALTWLAEAVACPQLLAQLARVVPDETRPAVDRFADVAAVGGSPVQVFTSELVEWVHSGGSAGADWTELAGGVLAPPWAGVVRCTGLEQVAAAGFAAGAGLDLCEQVMCHPRLYGGRAYRRARGRLVQAIGCGPLPDVVVVDRAPLVVSTSPHAVISWLAVGHDAAEDVAFAWAMLQRMVKRSVAHGGNGQLLAAARVAAAELACMAGPGAVVGGQALVCVQDLAEKAALNSTQATTLQVLAQLTGTGHTRRRVGGTRVDALCEAWWTLRCPSWMVHLVGEFLAGAVRVDDPVVLQSLLGLGDEFAGTFDDLVAVATAVAA